MAKPNYQFEKRQRDLAKKNKQEEKRRQKLAAKAAGETGGADDASAEDSDAEVAEGAAPADAGKPEA